VQQRASPCLQCLNAASDAAAPALMHQTQLCPSPAGQTIRGGYVTSSSAILLRMRNQRFSLVGFTAAGLFKCLVAPPGPGAPARPGVPLCPGAPLAPPAPGAPARRQICRSRLPKTIVDSEARPGVHDRCVQQGRNRILIIFAGDHQRLSTPVFNTTKLCVAGGRLSQARALAVSGRVLGFRV